jgi:hypothetical protein
MRGCQYLRLGVHKWIISGNGHHQWKFNNIISKNGFHWLKFNNIIIWRWIIESMNDQGILRLYFDLNYIMILNDKVYSIKCNVKKLWCNGDPSTPHPIHASFNSPFKTYSCLVWFLEMSKIVVNFLHDHNTRRHEVAKHAKVVFEDNNNSVAIDVKKFFAKDCHVFWMWQWNASIITTRPNDKT